MNSRIRQILDQITALEDDLQKASKNNMSTYATRSKVSALPLNKPSGRRISKPEWAFFTGS